MKGLLVKDFKLILLQKNFFLLILGIIIGMILFSDNITFPLAFLCFIISLFTVSTISYDDFDNGNAFLFTLPITRKTYVVEKYCLGLLFGGGAWMLAIILGIMVIVVKGGIAVIDLLMIAWLLLPSIIVIQAIMLPFQLKFGGEKARIAMVGVFGALVVIAIIILKGTKVIFNVDFVYLFNTLPIVSMGMFNVCAVIISLIILLVSMKISYSIVNKKEL